ncbi:MAG TPA: septum formation initiator family protein [Bacilli bacterium]|jgi:cell division protein DivIC|nr:septum formation initiator family protein [Bacilli bacterium]HPZ24074.1 septum formation initiator family protein [Bacilli bacterium]HQC83248.1 septum formation initiator family protein [Bacilli bacterium]
MGKFRLRIFVYLCIIAGIISFVTYNCFSTWQQILQNIQAKKDLETQYTELVDNEDNLEDQISKLKDPEYVAKYVREKFLYTKDGELIIDVNNNQSK